jgi:hypothetical protein
MDVEVSTNEHANEAPWVPLFPQGRVTFDHEQNAAKRVPIAAFWKRASPVLKFHRPLEIILPN